MTLPKIKTYYLLDSWAESPPQQGWQFVIDRLQLRGVSVSKKEVKQAVYERLIQRDLLPTHRKATARDWKQAKILWREHTSNDFIQ